MIGKACVQWSGGSLGGYGILSGRTYTILALNVSRFAFYCRDVFLLKGLPVALDKHILGFDTGGECSQSSILSNAHRTHSNGSVLSSKRD